MVVDSREDKYDYTQLHRDYSDGLSAMGDPTRGYYITSDRGMESLQSYATGQLIMDRLGVNDTTGMVREVRMDMTNDAANYKMATYTHDEYAEVLNEGLKAFDYENDYIDRTYGAYVGVLNTVYNGEADRDTLLNMAFEFNNKEISEKIELAMMNDIIRAREGLSDTYADAGAFAFYNHIAPNYNHLKEVLDPSKSGVGVDIESKVYGSSMMDYAKRAYLEYIVDEKSSDLEDSISIDTTKDILREVGHPMIESHFEHREKDWVELISYLDEGVVIMFESPEEDTPLSKLKYLTDVYEATSIDIIDDSNPKYKEMWQQIDDDKEKSGFDKYDFLGIGKFFKRDRDNDDSLNDIEDDGPDL